MERIRRLPGVKDVVHSTWFGGVYQDPKNFFPQFAVDAASYLDLYPEYVLGDAERKAFLLDRKGAVGAFEPPAVTGGESVGSAEVSAVPLPPAPGAPGGRSRGPRPVL